MFCLKDRTKTNIVPLTDTRQKIWFEKTKSELTIKPTTWENMEVERTNQAAPIGPVSVKSKETQHQSLQDFQKQAKQSLQEVMVTEVERANQVAPADPVSVKSKETQHQSLHEVQKQAKQSPQEIMVQTEAPCKVDAAETARNEKIQEMSNPSDYPFTMKNLTIIRRTDHKKQVHQLRLIDQMSPHWKKASDLLGLLPDHTNRIEMNHRTVENCCREVMAQWLAHGADSMYNYTITWEGLCQLLEDMELSAIAENVRLIVRPDST